MNRQHTTTMGMKQASYAMLDRTPTNVKQGRSYTENSVAKLATVYNERDNNRKAKRIANALHLGLVVSVRLCTGSTFNRLVLPTFSGGRFHGLKDDGTLGSFTIDMVTDIYTNAYRSHVYMGVTNHNIMSIEA